MNALQAEIFNSWIINGLLTQRRAFSETQKLRKPNTRGFHPTYLQWRMPVSTKTSTCAARWLSEPSPHPTCLLHTECAWKGGCTYKLHNVATHSVCSDMTNVEKFVSKIAPLEMQDGCVMGWLSISGIRWLKCHVPNSLCGTAISAAPMQAINGELFVICH